MKYNIDTLMLKLSDLSMGDARQLAGLLILLEKQEPRIGVFLSKLLRF